MCNVCSRLSRSLRVCDKCSSPLSEDNAAVCYSSSPKRNRTEKAGPLAPASDSKKNTTSDGNSATSVTLNGDSSPTGPAGNSSHSNTPPTGQKSTEPTMNGSEPPRPVPQALYVNKNVASQLPHGSLPGMPLQPQSELPPAPQSLFMNINSQMNNQPPPVPLPTPSSASAPVNNAQPPRLAHPPMAAPNTVVPVQNYGSDSNRHIGMVTNVMGTVSSATIPQQQQTQAQSQPVVAMQVNPAGVTSSHGMSSLGTLTPNLPSILQNSTMVPRTTLPSLTPQVQPPQTATQPVGTFSNTGGALSSTSTEGDLTYMGQGQVQFFASQIRIGIRKFKPSTPVMVKDDGVLFTLKGTASVPKTSKKYTSQWYAQELVGGRGPDILCASWPPPWGGGSRCMLS